MYHAPGSTTNGSAKTKGADSTVNGYLIFILYSVALLARTFISGFLSPVVLTLTSTFFFEVVRFIGSTAYMIIRLFAGE